MLEAAKRLISAWDLSGDVEPLRLPLCLQPEHRAALHAYCEHLGFAHESEGDEDDVRRLVVRSNQP